MKSTFFASLAALTAQRVAGHALFQQLWVDGTDMGSTCVRMPASNTPITNVAGRDIVCNVGGTKGVSGKCPVKAGGAVTIEIHQQPGDRKCNNEAIGGAHYGPVTAYLTKVPDAATADGSTSWFKIFENGWSSKGGSGAGDNDQWGTKDINTCCGKMDVKIPKDLPDGDYLLRAEALALHTAGSSGGAQFYVSCYQITLSGGGGSLPTSPLVKFPGAYKSGDPGIMINIHAALKGYTVPGPPVIAGGTTKVAGSGCEGCAKSCAAPAAGAKTQGKAVFEPMSSKSWRA